MCTLENKERYVLHYRNLKLYIRLGMLEFERECWLKPYIDFNTRKRFQAKTEFERMYYKLLNNSVFGKLMEAYGVPQEAPGCVADQLGKETGKTHRETDFPRMSNLQ